MIRAGAPPPARRNRPIACGWSPSQSVLRHRCVTAAMDCAWSALLQQALMLWCGVALVLAQVVAGVLRAEIGHECIARHFGDDRRRRYSDTQGIAVDYGTHIRQRQVERVANDRIGLE